jgi:hypothetical protein
LPEGILAGISRLSWSGDGQAIDGTGSALVTGFFAVVTLDISPDKSDLGFISIGGAGGLGFCGASALEFSAGSSVACHMSPCGTKGSSSSCFGLRLGNMRVSLMP